MALYWPEARFALDLMEGEVPRRSESEYPPGVLVLSVREEQVDDPEFLEEVRELIIRRTERFAPRHPASRTPRCHGRRRRCGARGRQNGARRPIHQRALRGARLAGGGRRRAGRRAFRRVPRPRAGDWLWPCHQQCAAGTACDQRLRGRHREARAGGLADASPQPAPQRL